MIEALNPTYSFEGLRREDGPRLGEINRRCPIVADFTFYFDRGEQFFAWADCTFDDYRYTGIYCEEELVGYGMIGLNSGWIGSELGQHLYLGDWRILPGHRGFSLGQQGAEELAVDLPEEVTCGYCLVKRGNATVEWILRTRSAAQWTVQPLCDFEAINLLLLFRPAAPQRHRIRRATTQDAELLADVMRQAWDGRLFAPVVSPEQVARDIGELQRSGDGAYFVAEQRGQVKGVLRAWDTHRIRRTVVLGYSRKGQAIRLAVAGARQLLRSFPSLPAPGQAFRSLTLHRVAVPNDDPEVLRDLLLAVVRDYHGQGYHMAHLGFCGGDPLRSAVRRLPAQRFESAIHLICRRGYDPPEAERGGPWVDLQRI